MKINQLLKGNKEFQKNLFPQLENNYDHLIKDGQSPEVLFIACSDSRVAVDMILDTKPGDIFIVRNIGNFVPPYKYNDDFHGSSAAIEYAVSVLGVKHIVVCGHSHCGACASLYQDLGDEPHLQHVRKWLELGYQAKEYTMLAIDDKSDKEKILRTTEKISIKHQLDNLLTYPEVYKKVKNKQLEIHGWYYKIEDGSIECYDRDSCKFKVCHF